jgi:hypothetical protein
MTASRRGRDTEGPGLPGAGGATLRGALLIAAAVLVGVVLLGKGFDTGFLPSSSDTPSEQAGDGDGDDGGTDGEGTDGEDATTTTVTPTTHAPAQVRVIVLNGGGPSGAAGTSSTALAGAGFTTLDAGNTDDVTASAVFYAETFQADAAAVAAALGITATPQALPATPPTGAPAAGQVDVVVVLGPDFTPVG